ncbi:hypothetical protein KIN20_021333 [Parelaphostrongylus tenuis]|uniref:Uncharacterized protein n=1 Tax=Parelaphostrongylus tenuis TaxID=148309 RepID=A0AAD5QU51_PARTN|nr:hypothetical protein KIN20_021333 [Parelaphostrongylus tenuis]
MTLSVLRTESLKPLKIDTQLGIDSYKEAVKKMKKRPDEYFYEVDVRFIQDASEAQLALNCVCDALILCNRERETHCASVKPLVILIDNVTGSEFGDPLSDAFRQLRDLAKKLAAAFDNDHFMNRDVVNSVFRL